MSAFHLSNEFWFRRLPNGDVVVEVRAVDGTVKHAATVTGHGWASAVAFVSARGETADTFREASAFHGGIQVLPTSGWGSLATSDRKLQPH